MLLPGIVPNLVIAQRVVDKIAAAATRYIEDETGEAMVGLVTPGPSADGVPTIYILDTISPDESAIRQTHTFQQGDARQDELIWWLQENWHAQRQQANTNPKWAVPLRYLGDWHKQPGYMIAPSMGDLATALAWLDDDENEMTYLLAPIVTLGHPSSITPASTTVNYLLIPQEDGEAIRIDFWYIHREVGMFQPIHPAVYPDDLLPELTAYPWHLLDEHRLTLELARFEQNQMFTSVLLWDTDAALPLEVCIASARMGARQIYLIATPWDYPKNPPQVRLAPFTSIREDQAIADVFGEWWAKSEAAPHIPGWRWTQDTHLIDYIQAIEEALGIQPEPVQVHTPPGTEAQAAPHPAAPNGPNNDEDAADEIAH